jgi:hypothetical protein
VLTGWRFVVVVTGLFAVVAISIHQLFDLVERWRVRRGQRRLIAGQEGVRYFLSNWIACWSSLVGRIR